MSTSKKDSKVIAKEATRPSFHKDNLIFDKSNYMIMGIGLVVMLIGFALMIGGASPNPNEFHPETLYSFNRVTLGPIIILISFGIQFYSIFKKDKPVTE